MFSLVTEKKIEFGWQVFVSPRSTKTLEALVKPKKITKTLILLPLLFRKLISPKYISYPILNSNQLPFANNSRQDELSAPLRRDFRPASPCPFAGPAHNALIR